MGLLGIFRRKDINGMVEMFRHTPGAVLLDVRTEEEYRKGAIPGSVNMPLSDIDHVTEVIQDYSTPVFVYCRAGHRAARAAARMRKLGYQDVKDIGGIVHYKSEIR